MYIHTQYVAYKPLLTIKKCSEYRPFRTSLISYVTWELPLNIAFYYLFCVFNYYTVYCSATKKYYLETFCKRLEWSKM